MGIYTLRFRRIINFVFNFVSNPRFMTPKTINVIIADDHALFRRSLAAILTGFEFINEIREARNGKILMEMVAENQPNLVFLDLEMPVMDGFEAASMLVKEFPKVKILILTMHNNPSFVNYLWNSGVHGYLVKNSEIDEMKRAILSVMEKDFFKSEVIQKESVRQTLFQPQIKSGILSARERQILKLICKEFTSKEIAENLTLSRRTVEIARTKIMEKLKIKGTVELVRFAIKNNLI